MMRRSTSVAEIATSAAQKNAATAASQVSPKRSTQRGDEERRRRLDERVPPRDRRPAVAAAPAQEREREQRDVVVPRERSPARHAGRAGADDRAPQRDPRGDDVQEAPEREAGQERDGCERPRPSQEGRLFRRTMLSVSTKRWLAFAGVSSTASDTDELRRWAGARSTRCRPACPAGTGPAGRRCSR